MRDLTLDLIGTLLPAIRTDDNTVCSGYGLWCALAALLAGSDEDTAKSLSLALRADQSTVASVLGALDQRRHDVGGASHELEVWSRLPIDRALRESVGMISFGSLEDHPYRDPSVGGGTPELIPQSPITIGPADMLAVVDAIYLVGGLAEPFAPNATTGQGFTRADGTLVDVPTMCRSLGRDAPFAIHGAGPNQRTTVVSLFCRPGGPGPNGSNGMDGCRNPIAQAHLRVALGPPDMTAMAVIHDLLANFDRRIDCDRVDLRLPRFTTRSRHDLAGPLESMGLGGLFRAGVDLSRLSPEPLVLSQAIQQIMVEVGEGDVNAGTAIDTGVSALPLTESTIIDLAFDRPFAYALVDPDLDLPILVGWVADPTAT